ncbi:glycine/sarcosine/betaine reductase selenoprotein B family protein [Deltaproteobacteria bacterium TL4]
MSKRSNRFLKQIFKIPWVKERWLERFNAIEMDSIPWTPLTKPLRECRIALITTGGVHLKKEAPFDMNDAHGDPDYRMIPSNVLQADLQITHDYYDHRDADKDINLVFPIDILRNLQQREELGPSVETFYSFMGHIEGLHLTTLKEKTAKEVAALLKRQHAEIVLLVPA